MSQLQSFDHFKITKASPPQMSFSILQVFRPDQSPERGPGPEDHAQEEAAQTGMSQWGALPKEALPDPAPHTWHISASPPHRRLWLKTQAGSCWLKIHLSVYYDLCMFHWARNKKREENSFITAYCVYVCGMPVCELYVCVCVCVCTCVWLAGRWGIVKIMDCTWASLECLAYRAKSSVFTKHLHFTGKTTTIEIRNYPASTGHRH